MMLAFRVARSDKGSDKKNLETLDLRLRNLDPVLAMALIFQGAAIHL